MRPPLAFAYHLVHSFGPLVREADGLGVVPFSMMELHARHTSFLIPEPLLFALQAGLMVFGFWLAVQVLCGPGAKLVERSGVGPLLSVLGFGCRNGFQSMAAYAAHGDKDVNNEERG